MLNAFDIFFSFIARWTLNFITFYDQDNISSSHIGEMKYINLERPCHRSIMHVSNLGNVVKYEVHFRRKFSLPIGSQHGPIDRDHIHFDENMIAMHRRFR